MPPYTQLVSGSSTLPTVVGPGTTLTVAAGNWLRVSWAVPRVLTSIELQNDDDTLQVTYNAVGVANVTYNKLVTKNSPAKITDLAITSLWFFNPGATDIVFNGTGKNASCDGWA